MSDDEEYINKLNKLQPLPTFINPLNTINSDPLNIINSDPLNIRQ